ncbi:MAG: CAP domain-containing protein [Euryarchaeota archaeon]|nr:CAP domain-containing protein [Euryarchaeota archaeon]
MKRWIITLAIVPIAALSLLFVFHGIFDPVRNIPDPYYQDDGHNVTNRSELIQILPLLTDAYQEDYFDCSEMSAFMEWYLEGHGVDTVIVAGARNQPHNISARGFEYEKGAGDHAWIVANVSGESLLIESTLARVVPKSLEKYYLADKIYTDIYDAVGSSRSVEEYDWWTVVDIGSPVPFKTPVSLPASTEIETDIFNRVNAERMDDGLLALKQNDEIAEVARAYSRDLAARRDSGDNDDNDDNDELGDLLKKSGISHFDISIEQTLSVPGPVYDYEEFLQTCLDAWAHGESGEYAGAADLDESGIGVAVCPDGNVYITHVSIRRIHCGYKGAPCCKEQGYYPWCYKPWECNRGICE